MRWYYLRECFWLESYILTCRQTACQIPEMSSTSYWYASQPVMSYMQSKYHDLQIQACLKVDAHSSSVIAECFTVLVLVDSLYSCNANFDHLCRRMILDKSCLSFTSHMPPTWSSKATLTEQRHCTKQACRGMHQHFACKHSNNNDSMTS